MVIEGKTQDERVVVGVLNINMTILNPKDDITIGGPYHEL